MEKVKTLYHVSLQEVKDHLRITYNTDDALLNRLIIAGHQVAENFTEKDIALTTNTLTDKVNGINVLTIDEGNFIAVTTFTIDGQPVTGYEVTPKENSFVIELDSPIKGEMVLEFQTGYPENKCPEATKCAILIKIGELYDVDRSGHVPNSFRETKAFQHLLAHYKKLYF